MSMIFLTQGRLHLLLLGCGIDTAKADELVQAATRETAPAVVDGVPTASTSEPPAASGDATLKITLTFDTELYIADQMRALLSAAADLVARGIVALATPSDAVYADSANRLSDRVTPGEGRRILQGIVGWRCTSSGVAALAWRYFRFWSVHAYPQTLPCWCRSGAGRRACRVPDEAVGAS